MKTQLLKKISPIEVLKVTVSINDDCKNGYEDINVTTVIYNLRKKEKGEEKITFENKVYTLDSCGMDDKTVLEHFPKLAPVLLVNGCDMFGFHTYPLGNIQYHCIHDPDYAKVMYRLTDEEVALFGELNYTALAKRMYNLSITRYKKEIDEAVAIVEALTGEKYIRKEKVSHQLYNDIVYYITSNVPKKERGWNMINGTYPTAYPDGFNF